MHLVSGTQATLILWSYRAAGAMMGCAITEVALKAIKPHTKAPIYAAGALLGARVYPYLPWVLSKCSPSWRLPLYIASSMTLFVSWVVCSITAGMKLQGNDKWTIAAGMGSYLGVTGLAFVKVFGWEHTKIVTQCCSLLYSQENLHFEDFKRLIFELWNYSDISDDLFEALIDAPIQRVNKDYFFFQLAKDCKGFSLPFYTKQNLLKLTFQFGETASLYDVLSTVMQAAEKRPDIQKKILDAFPLNAQYHNVPKLHPETVAHLLAKPEPTIFDAIACRQFKEPVDLDACIHCVKNELMWVLGLIDAMPTVMAKKLIDYDLKNESVLLIDGYNHFEEKDPEYATTLKPACIDLLKKGFIYMHTSRLMQEMIDNHLPNCTNRALVFFLLYHKHVEENYNKIVKEIRRRSLAINIDEIDRLSLFLYSPHTLIQAPSLQTLRWVANNDTNECMRLIQQIATYYVGTQVEEQPDHEPDAPLHWMLCNYPTHDVPETVKRSIQTSPEEYGRLMGSCARIKERRTIPKHKAHLPYLKRVEWFGIQDLDDREKFVQGWYAAYHDRFKPLNTSSKMNLVGLLSYFLTEDKVESLYQTHFVSLLASQMTYASDRCSEKWTNADATNWAAVPIDVVKIVFSFLPPKDIGRVGRACKRFYNITYTQDGMHFWKKQGLGSIDAVRFMWKFSKWLKNPKENTEIPWKPLSEENVSFVSDVFALACPTSIFPARAPRSFREKPEGEIDLETTWFIQQFGVPYASIPHFCAWFNKHPTLDNWQLFHKIHKSFPLFDLRAHLNVDVLNRFYQGSLDDPFS